MLELYQDAKEDDGHDEAKIAELDIDERRERFVVLAGRLFDLIML